MIRDALVSQVGIDARGQRSYTCALAECDGVKKWGRCAPREGSDGRIYAQWLYPAT